LKSIYLDNAATSFPKPIEVSQAVFSHITQAAGNAGRGNHQVSQEAGAVLRRTRQLLAALFHVREAEQIGFALNITQAINFALYGLLRPGDHVITTDMEHNAVARPLQALSRQGIRWSRVAAAGTGCLDLAALETMILPETKLICLPHASNVTGAVMPLEEAGRIAADHGVLFMVDAAQSAGVWPIDAQRQHVDLLAFTGHKGLFGPQGVGGLYVRPGLQLRPLWQGGTGSASESLEQPEFMPDLMESGTMNLPGIAGLGAGVEFICHTGADAIRRREAALLDDAWERLSRIPRIKLYGSGDSSRQACVISFNLADEPSTRLGEILDRDYHIVTRSGLHCAALAHQSLGTSEQGTCRMSPGYFTTEAEIEYAAAAIAAAARRF
jgi:cysteine desulfurase family protein